MRKNSRIPPPPRSRSLTPPCSRLASFSALGYLCAMSSPAHEELIATLNQRFADGCCVCQENFTDVQHTPFVGCANLHLLHVWCKEKWECVHGVFTCPLCKLVLISQDDFELRVEGGYQRPTLDVSFFGCDAVTLVRNSH